MCGDEEVVAKIENDNYNNVMWKKRDFMIIKRAKYAVSINMKIERKKINWIRALKLYFFYFDTP